METIKIAGTGFAFGIFFTIMMGLSSWSPLSFFQKSRETLIEERDAYYDSWQECQAKLNVELSWQEQTKYEWATGNMEFVNFIDSVRNSRQ